MDNSIEFFLEDGVLKTKHDIPEEFIDWATFNEKTGEYIIVDVEGLLGNTYGTNKNGEVIKDE